MTRPLPMQAPRAILFDLDGTLADTAPDLAAAVNFLRTERGLEPTPYAVLRPTASAGARGMIGAAFGLTPADDGYEELRLQWFDRYQSRDGGAQHAVRRRARTARRHQRRRHGMGHRHQQAGALHRSADSADRAGARRLHHLRRHHRARQAAPGAAAGSARAGWASRRSTAGTSATTCATSKRAARPAWSRSPAPGAIAARSSRRTWGADYLLDTPIDLLATLRGILDHAAAGSQLVA